MQGLMSYMSACEPIAGQETNHDPVSHVSFLDHMHPECSSSVLDGFQHDKLTMMMMTTASTTQSLPRQRYKYSTIGRAKRRYVGKKGQIGLATSLAHVLLHLVVLDLVLVVRLHLDGDAVQCSL